MSARGLAVLYSRMPVKEQQAFERLAGIRDITRLPPVERRASRKSPVPIRANRAGRCVTCDGLFGVGDRIYASTRIGTHHAGCYGAGGE